MSGTEHDIDDISEDGEGWWWCRCGCGWTMGPFPAREDAQDSISDHFVEELS